MIINYISLMVLSVQVFSVSDDLTRNLIVAAIFLDEVNNREILGLCNNCDVGVAEEERPGKLFSADERIFQYGSLLFHNSMLYALISSQDDDDFDFDKGIGDEINHFVVHCEVKLKLINIVKYKYTAHHIEACDSEVEIAHSGLKYVYLVKSIYYGRAAYNLEQDSEDEDDYDLKIYRTSKLTIE